MKLKVKHSHDTHFHAKSPPCAIVQVLVAIHSKGYRVESAIKIKFAHQSYNFLPEARTATTIALYYRPNGYLVSVITRKQNEIYKAKLKINILLATSTPHYLLQV